MKKLLGSALALALILSFSQANAELLKNFKLGGSVEMNATSARNVLDFQTRRDDAATATKTGSDRIGAAQTRITIAMDWDLLDDVHAKVTLGKNDRVYGNASQSLGYRAAGTEGVAGNVYVHEGYFKIDKLFGVMDTTFGRQFFGDEGDLVIYYGAKHNLYGMDVTAVDAAKFDWSGEKAYVTALAGRADNAVNTLANYGVALDGQQDLRGLVIGSKGIENLDAKVYVWNAATHRAAAAGVGANASKNDNLYVAGIKVKGKLGGAYGSLEFAKNFGTNRTGAANTDGSSARYTGYAFLLDGGMKAEVEQIGSFNPWAQFGLGSGRNNASENQNDAFAAIASDYRPGAIYGRFANGSNLAFGRNLIDSVPTATTNNAQMNGLSNRVLWGLGIKATPTSLNKLTVGASYWDFRFHRLTQTRANPGKEALGNKHIGYELDLDAEWKHSENVSLKAAVGTFQPGGYIKEIKKAATSPVNPAVMTSFDVAVKF